MKFYLLLNTMILFLVLSINLMGQYSNNNVSIEDGPQIKFSHKSTMWKSKIVGIENEILYALRYRQKDFGAEYEYELIKFDDSGNIVSRVKILNENKTNNYNVEEIVLLGEDLILFASEIKDGNKLLVTSVIDKETLKLESDFKELGKYPISYGVNKGVAKIDFVFSDDNRKLLVLVSTPRTKGTNKQYIIKVFDENLVELRTEKITVENNSIELVGFTLTNDCEGGILLKKRKKGIQNYQLLSWLKDTDDLKKNDFVVNAKFDSSLKLTNSPNGNLICTGFYSEVEKMTQGSIYVKFDKKNNALELVKQTPFSINQVIEARFGKEKEKLLKLNKKGKLVGRKYIEVREMIAQDNGELILIGEEYSPAYNDDIYANFYFGDIVVIRFNSEGTFEWVKIIQKGLERSHYNEAEYFYLIGNEKLFFSFEDYPNLKVVSVNENGIEREEFSTKITKSIGLISGAFIQNNNDELFIIAETTANKTDYFKLVKIFFKD